MFVKSAWVLVGGLTLAACTQTIPDSGAGVGFGDYDQYLEDQARAQADAAGTTTPILPPQAISDEVTTDAAIPTSELAAAGIGTDADVGAPLSAVGTRLAGLDASPTNAEPEISGNVQISDEQDFQAVSSRESIERDAERLAAAAAARQEAEVTALPTRPSETGPNIVAYALNAPNALGQEWYSRSLLSGQARFERNCAGYNTPDAAQRYFLARGGPERDPRGIDPDGDGFACGWDPAPFRLAAGG